MERLGVAAEGRAGLGDPAGHDYYYYPGSWLADRPGFMNGSGMPMRFTDTDGSMIDVYQANTSMTDESEQSFPFTPDTLLDRALGPLGYYGAFTANLHTDNASTFEDTQVLASAQERGVPVISARQLLTWTDGRNGSSFGNLSWDGTGLGFTIGVGAGATALTAMLPSTGPGGSTLTSVTRGSTTVAVTTMTVKGQQYAVFPAVGGTYRASYGAGGQAAVTGVSAQEVSADAAAVTWRTASPASTVLELGTSPGSLTTEVKVAERTEEHRAALTDLRPATRYHYRVRSRGADGTWRLWPAAGQPPATFTTAARDVRAPVISGVRTLALPDGTARVTWRTSERATSLVRFGRVAAAPSRVRLDRALTRHHTVVLTGLATHRAYALHLGSRDAAGNAAVVRAARLRTGAAGLAMQTAEELRTGLTSGTAVVTGAGLGSLSVRGAGAGRLPLPRARLWAEGGLAATGAGGRRPGRLATGGRGAHRQHAGARRHLVVVADRRRGHPAAAGWTLPPVRRGPHRGRISPAEAARHRLHALGEAAARQ